MRFAYEWIREYAPVDCSPKELARRLTAAGLSVERIAKESGEHLLELDITTNRPDCMNLYGICREAAALSGTRLRRVRPRLRETGPPIATRARVEVREKDLCSRYSARVMLGVRIQPSPPWIRKRLLSMGIRPINLIVDVTNYVLLELGQPLHAFDLDLLEKHRIVVRRARQGETITTLDGVQRNLRSEDLVIADARRPVAIAGVIGGQDTEIRESTRNILLESAYFHPQSVRRTARRFGLHTEASHRFERGADREITRLALDRCCELLLAHGNGQVARGTLDIAARGGKTRSVTIRADRTSRLLGDRVSIPNITRALRSLGFRAGRTGTGKLTVAVPTFRSDIEEEVDLIEEVARFRGYDRIPSRLPLLPGRGVGRSVAANAIRHTRRTLRSLGYQEVLNLSMVDPDLEERFSGDPSDRVAITNPLSERASVLRRSLLPGLLENIAFNRNRGMENLKLFEVGRGFANPVGKKSLREENLLGIAVTGSALPEHWSRSTGPYSFFHLKGTLETLLKRLGFPEWEFRKGTSRTLEANHQAVLLVEGKIFGSLGRLRGDLTESVELDPGLPIFVAELHLDILKATNRQAGVCRAVPRHPAVRRDLSLIVDAGQQFGEIERLIRGIDGKRISRVELFDRFRPQGLSRDKMSLGIRVEFQQPDRTLLKEEVAGLEERILGKLNKELGITLRVAPESGHRAAG